MLSIYLHTMNFSPHFRSNTAAKLFDASGNSPKNGNVGGNVENHQTPGFVHDFHQQVMNQVARTYYTTFNKLYVLFVFEHPNPLGEKTVAGGVQSATAQFASKVSGEKMSNFKMRKNAKMMGNHLAISNL